MVKAGCETVPVGVIVSAPPVVPTLPCPVVVPVTVNPSRSVASVYPAEQAPAVIIKSEPDGKAVPPPPTLIQAKAFEQVYRSPVALFNPSWISVHAPLGMPGNWTSEGAIVIWAEIDCASATASV